MQKSEFEVLIGRPVPVDLYKEIEYVYNFHPAIPNVSGKSKIAAIYKAGGMGVIRSMRPIAEKAEQAEKEILQKRNQISELEKQIADIRAQFRPYAEL